MATLSRAGILCLVLIIGLLPSTARAQNQDRADLERQVTELRALVEKLEARVDELSARMPPASTAASVNVQPAPRPPVPQPDAPPPPSQISLLRGTTFNFLLDGYYEYNFNAPIGRANLLRAFDVSSNSFSLNQAAAVLENAPDPDHGRRWGLRLDLQWGQATQTLQGNAANEPRPDIYRAIFQAYGTYVIPIGKGITADFGKFASPIGIEGNYTKDQMNYSRSYWFDYLPYYHMGVRLTYNFSDKWGVSYWVTNGTQQTEAFNGFRDEFIGLNLQPRKNLNWKINYYFGQEHPDVQFFPYGAPAGLTNLPALQGVPFEVISPAPNGRLHIFDSYLTWNASPALSFAAEGDWVIERLFRDSEPSHVAGGAAYAHYQLTPKVAVAARAEYLSDRGGLFSGATQALKEATVTTEYKFADNFLLRWEWRRDFSNQPYFYTDTPGVLSRRQTTLGVGLVWWTGAKQGPW